MQRNVRSAFRLHSRIADLDASVLIEFMTKSARKLVVQPPTTVGLWFCFCAFHDVSHVFFSATELTTRGVIFRYLSAFVFFL